MRREVQKTRERTHDVHKHIAKNLRLMRNAKGISQTKLAEDLFISRSTYSDYENGKKVPDLQTMGALASYHDLNIDLLVNHDLSKGLTPGTHTQSSDDDLAMLLNECKHLSAPSRALMTDILETLLAHESANFSCTDRNADAASPREQG